MSSQRSSSNVSASNVSGNNSSSRASSSASRVSSSKYWLQQTPGLSPVAVRRPKAIVFDILGTASKSGFLERILFPYLKVNLEPYINTHWLKKDFLKLYERIVAESTQMNGQDQSCPLVLPHERPDAKQSLITYINFITENSINSPPVTQLRFKVWFEGYQSARIRTPIYSDVPNRMRAWYAEGIKFHVFSNTWVEAQQALLKNTNHGDLTNLIAGHYDNDFGMLTDTDSWRRLCMQIHQSPNDVLFLTKSPAEALAAQEAGICVVLVLTHRHNVRAVSHQDRQRFPYVRTLNDLQWLDGSQSMMPASSGTLYADTQRTELTNSAVPSGGGGGGGGAGGAGMATSATGVSSTSKNQPSSRSGGRS